MKRALLGLLLFLPCGCRLVEPPRVDVEAVTQSLNSAVESLTSVEASLRDERSKLLARYDADRRCFEQLLANIQAATIAARAERLPLVLAELSVADSRLKGYTADPTEVSAAAERARLFTEDRSAFDKALAEAIRQGNESAAKAAALESDIKQATETANQALLRAKESTDRLKSAVDEARGQERLKVRDAQIASANDWGGRMLGVALVALLLTYWLREKALVVSVLAGAGSAGCFAYARYIDSAWFPWLVGLGIVTCLGLVVYVLHRKEEAAGKAKYLNVALATSAALDAAYDRANAEQKDVLDNLVFSEIEKTYPDIRRRVHEIKALPEYAEVSKRLTIH